MRRVLGDIADQPATGLAQGLAAQLEQAGVGDLDAACGDARTAPGMGQQGGGQGGLARAGLTDQAEDFAGGQGEVDVVDDVGASVEFNPQVLHLQGRPLAGKTGSHRFGSRPRILWELACQRWGQWGI
ncbi:hypothetical protein D3C85_1223610 [compost metagenome]